jgi:hypothetical protein
MTLVRTLGRGLAAAGVLWALTPAIAFADPPQATDYLTVVTGVEPAVPGIDVRIVGGDSFIELEAAPGTSVMVVGYQGEDYIRFDPDGVVQENRRSPSWYASQSRYSSPVPIDITPDTAPEWHTVSTDGIWAWHDHRSHWMGDSPPLGTQPGDRVNEGVIPLRVDGVDVAVSTMSTWEQPPSPVPGILGASLGAALGMAIWLGVGGRRGAGLLVFAMAVLATVFGAWQFLSVPAETGPPSTSWIIPVVALVASAVAVFVPRISDFACRALLVLASVELVQWAYLRRQFLVKPVLPTAAPEVVDRLLTATVLTAAAIVLAFLVASLVRELKAPARDPQHV